MSGDKPRDYQTNGINAIREEFRQGHQKVLLWLATGAGKTYVFCKMVKDAVARGRRCIIVVRGRKLVDQASKRLMREGVYHGVLMAGHWLYKPSASVQVCSIDTLIARELKPEADLIIIDEAHLATSEGYVNFLAQYTSAFVVAVTATPWVNKPLTHIANTIVHPITMLELIEQGYLVGARYFAPAEPDLTAVRVSRATNDYVTEELEEAMTKGNLTGDIVNHWIRHGEGKPTLCFAVNVHHSKLLVERFLAAGIPAEHCDAESNDERREEVIRRLESGETKVVCNVGIFCTGVDIVKLGVVVMARPTKSKNLFIQQAGRGTRPLYADGFDLENPEGRLAAIAASPKPNFILLDHAGNIMRHGLPTDETEVFLDGDVEEKKPRESKVCKECFAVFRGSICPECGVAPPAPPAEEIKEKAGELKELVNVEVDPVKRSLKALQKEGKLKGRHHSWAYYRLIDRFGFEAAKPHLPESFTKKLERDNASLFSRSPFRGVRPQSQS